LNNAIGIEDSATSAVGFSIKYLINNKVVPEIMKIVKTFLQSP